MTSSRSAAEVKGRVVRGSFTTSALDHGSPFDALDMTESELRLRRAMKPELVVAVGDVEGIRARRHRSPLIWRTTFHFRCVDDSNSFAFVPYRSRRLLRTLTALGWPVESS